MSERSVIITENNGAYQIQNSGLNDFELLGLLEQVIFDLKNSKKNQTEPEKVLKTATTTEQGNKQPETPALETAEPKTAAPPIENTEEKATEKADKKAGEPKAEKPQKSPASASSADLRTRIGNAVKAIRDLGGKIENVDLSEMSDDELQTELEELTAQYKRLKSSKSGK